MSNTVSKTVSKTVQQQKTGRGRHPRGMTLIEIMVVITILGMLMAAVAVVVIPHLNSSKRQRVRMDFHALRGALTLYYAKHGRFPDAATGLRALVEMRAVETLPQDPWNKEYVYQLEKGEPRLLSYGEGGEVGGEGAAADLCSCDSPSAAANDP